MGLSAVLGWFPIHLFAQTVLLYLQLSSQQWASFASKQKGLGAIALGEDQPGDANGDACLQILRRIFCMCCVTPRSRLLYEDPKIQVHDIKSQDLETKL